MVSTAKYTRITSMKKTESIKDRILVPVSGIAVVVTSILTGLIVLYLVTIVVRFLFSIGS